MKPQESEAPSEAIPGDDDEMPLDETCYEAGYRDATEDTQAKVTSLESALSVVKSGRDVLQKRVDALEERLAKAVEALEFYAKGGNFNMDLWEHKELGHFTGKLAKEVLREIEK